MAWIKRNLVLVISGALAIALLGFGAFYLFSAIQKNNQINQEIESTKAEIQRLLGKPVTPTTENLKLAKQEAVKLNQFVGEAKKLFPSSPNPTEPLTVPAFKSTLANRINELHKLAATVPTRLESNAAGPYYFTFEAQRLALNIAPESLQPLSDRLHEVEFIAQTLFKSRINRLVGMRRALVPGERPTGGGNAPGGGNDYLSVSARTNAETSMMVWPYEVTFDCFSSDLALVVNGLQNSKYAFIVKTVEWETSPDAVNPRRTPNQRNPRNPPTQPGQTLPPRRGAQPAPARPGVVNPRANAAAAPATGTSQLITIIDEQLVRVTMRLDVIKPDTTPSGGPGGRRGGRP